MIKKCDCKHKFQDEQYGVSNRVMNKTTNGFRCTVCDKEHKTGDIRKK